MDQFTAIIGRHDPDAIRQRRFDIVDLPFDAVDNLERVLSITHYYDSADDFALTIQLSHAASQRAAKMDLTDVLYVHRRAVFNLEYDVLDVGDAFEITAAAHEIFRGRDFEGFSTHVAVARLH